MTSLTDKLRSRIGEGGGWRLGRREGGWLVGCAGGEVRGGGGQWRAVTFGIWF